jgi:ubiquinone/menaquinone biosynthesis C-methylase UbiE
MTDPSIAIAKRTLFNRWAPTYDWLLPSVFYQAIHQRLLEFVQLPANAHVLDIGCGTGKLLNRLTKVHPDLTGIGLDFSQEMLGQARQKSDASSRLTYVQGASDRIPLPNDAFDAVFCTISFLHYPDPLAVLKEIHRVLKGGGCFYLADYTPSKCSAQATTSLPVVAGQIRFYSADARTTLAHEADLEILEHHYLLGPILLTIFQKPQS